MKLKLSHALLSTGELGIKAELSTNNFRASELAPSGLTVGLREPISRHSSEEIIVPSEIHLTADASMSQLEFDRSIQSINDPQVRTAVSLAFLRLKSLLHGYSNCELHRYIANEFNIEPKIPTPIMNIINCGTHGNINVSACEFMIIPRDTCFADAIKTASKIYLELGNQLSRLYGFAGSLVGREGGFSPPITSTSAALASINSAIERTGSKNVDLAIDFAANEYTISTLPEFTYSFDGKQVNAEQLASAYSGLLDEFSTLAYFEDPFHEDDHEGYRLKSIVARNNLMWVGDDLTVTNSQLILNHKEVIDACILKLNQATTVSNFVSALRKARELNKKVIVSQRSAETDSDILSHMAVGLGADYVKAGPPARERIVKYNTLLDIDCQLQEIDTVTL